MPFITEANLRKFLRTINPSSLDLGSVHVVYKLMCLNKLDVFYLRSWKSILKDENFIRDSKLTLTVKPDNYKWVYEGRSPAFHYSNKCSKLFSDYENFEVPSDIREKGKDTVFEFRSWFVENKERFKLCPEVFEVELLAKYGIHSNLKGVFVQRNSAFDINELSLEELDKAMSKLMRKNLSAFNGKKQNIFRSYGRQIYLAYRDDVLDPRSGVSDNYIKSILKDFDENVRKPLIRNIELHYRIKYNPELEFEKEQLELAGFKPCSYCSHLDKF